MKRLLRDICDIQYGYAFDSNLFSTTKGIPLVRIRDVVRGYSETYTEEAFPEKYIVENGDLLIGMDGEFNIARWQGGRAALNQRVCKLIPRANIESRYLFYAMPSKLKAIEDKTPFVTVKHLSAPKLNAIEIQLPSIEQQKAVADCLDAVNHSLDLCNRILAKLDTLVKSRFVEMFGDPVTNSKEYPIYKLSDITTSRLGKMLDKKRQTGKNKYPYLANYNVQWFRLELDNLNEMDFDEADRQEFELRDGDLLVCEGGEVGRCAIWRGEKENCYFQKALHRVRCNPKYIIPEYLGWTFYWHSQYNGFIDAISGVSTIAHLPGDKLKQLRIIVPPIDLQNQFADFVAQADKSKLAIHKLLEKQEILRAALMQEYFG